MARHRTRRNRTRRNYKNIINKTLDQSVSVVKSTSRKYMPKVKSVLNKNKGALLNVSGLR